ncbi:MAG: hypothetical protein NTW08_10220 [Gammaproteobacteria bacterium]|nr:hypothetical protein [Gammaproteobacteria bacterium]
MTSLILQHILLSHHVIPSSTSSPPARHPLQHVIPSSTSSRAQRGISCYLVEIPRCARDDVVGQQNDALEYENDYRLE